MMPSTPELPLGFGVEAGGGVAVDSEEVGEGRAPEVVAGDGFAWADAKAEALGLLVAVELAVTERSEGQLLEGEGPTVPGCAGSSPEPASMQAAVSKTAIRSTIAVVPRMTISPSYNEMGPRKVPGPRSNP
ncbi:MAG: hypothetical protein ABIQ47_12220 [Tepidiformaceae bacterium]